MDKKMDAQRREQLELLIDQALDQKQPLPEPLREAIQQDEQLRAYYESMRALYSSFEETSLPAPPESLNDDVMRYIAHQQNQPTLWEHIENHVFGFAAGLNEMLRGVPVPNVLRREAWPTAFASIVIVWSVFIAPQVQADKLKQIIDHPWVQKVDAYTMQFRAQTLKAADNIQQFTESLILQEQAINQNKNTTSNEEDAKPQSPETNR